MIGAPKTGESALDWCERLYRELQPLLRATGAGDINIRKSGAAWRFAAERARGIPFTFLPLRVEADPDDPTKCYLFLSAGQVELPTDGEYIALTPEAIPDSNDADQQVHKVELAEGDNWVYLELEITSLDDLTASTVKLDKTETEEDVMNEAPTYRRKLCYVEVTADDDGNLSGEIKIVYHVGNWEFRGALGIMTICQDGDLVDVLVSAVNDPGA